MLNSVKNLLALSVAGALAGCGGGSSSGSDINVPSEPEVTNQTISGIAEAPTSFTFALRDDSFFQLALDAFAPPVAAAVFGLEAIANKEVDLIQVDADGNQIGGVLASATTDENGEFELTLPDNTNLGPNLIVRIMGVGGFELRNQAVRARSNINPATEFATSKVAEQSALTGLTEEDIVGLQEAIEEFQVEIDGQTPEQAAQTLEQSVGEFARKKVKKGKTQPASAEDRAVLTGDFTFSQLQIALEDDNFSEVGGSIEFSLGASNINLSADETGAVSGTAIDVLDLAVGTVGSDLTDNSFRSSFELGLDSTSDREPGTLNLGDFRDDGVLYLEIPSDIEDYDGSGTVTQVKPPRLATFQRSGSTDVFVGAVNDQAGVYDVTVSEAAAQLPRPSTSVGSVQQAELNTLISKATGATIGDVDGRFGLAQLIPSVSEGVVERLVPENLGIQSAIQILDADGSNGLIDTLENRETRVSYLANGSLFLGPTGSQTGTGATGLSYTVSSEGILTIQDPRPEISEPIFAATVDSDYDFLFGGRAVASQDGSGNQTGGIAFSVGVKLPTENNPVLDGRQYRVTRVAYGFGEGQATLGDIHLIRSQSTSSMDFTDNTSGSYTKNDETILKDESNGGIIGGGLSKFSTSENLPMTITAPNDPQADFWELSIDGGAIVADGYFNATGDVGVFATRQIAENDSVPQTLGVMILSEIPHASQ